jgi:hypothetical protein
MTFGGACFGYAPVVLPPVLDGKSVRFKCPLLAQSGHGDFRVSCPLLTKADIGFPQIWNAIIVLYVAD